MQKKDTLDRHNRPTKTRFFYVFDHKLRAKPRSNLHLYFLQA